MKTPLQLDAYLLDRLEVEALEDFDDARESSDLHMEVEPQHLVCEGDPLAHQLTLRIPFGPSEPGSAPYRGVLSGRAFFRVSQELDSDQVAQYILVNGSAILFGLLRGQISQVTAMSRWGTLLLPPINLVEAFADWAQPHAESGQ